MLCNQGDEDMDELMWGMYNAVIGLPLDESHTWFIPTGKPFSAPEMIVGRYIGHEGEPSIADIRLENGRLCGERGGNPFVMLYCGAARFWAANPVTGELRFRLEFLIRDGRAWGVRCGTRVFERCEP